MVKTIGAGAGMKSGNGESYQMRNKDNKKTITKDRIIDYAVFALLLAAASAVTLNLFYHQCIWNMKDSGMYHADMKAYILEMQGLNEKYSFPYPIFFKFSALLNIFLSPELAVALATMLLNSLSMVIVKAALNKMTLASLEEAFPTGKWIAGVIISVVSIGLFFVSMVYPPDGIYLPGILNRWLGVFSANPFHNATYMAARPFAILTFLWYVKLLDVYEKGAEIKDYLLFSVFLLLTTMTKPSFTIVLVGAAGLIMLYRLIRHKCQNIKETLCLGITFVPTFLALLYQFKGVFVPEEGAEGGIGFEFCRVWTRYCKNIPLAIGLGVGFPILVLILNHREWLTNTLFRFSWQIFGMGVIMNLLLYEKGFREPDFNFCWGYMYGIFFAFLGAVYVLIRKTAEKKRPALLALQWLAFLWHLLSGLVYFFGLCQGKMYY